MKTSRKSIAIILVVFGYLVGNGSRASSAPLPSDASIVRLFIDHKDQFERLRVMVTEDSASQSYFSKLDLNAGMSETRKQEYRALINAIAPDLILTVDYNKTVRFVLFGEGSSAIGPGSLKGLAYVPTAGNARGKEALNLDEVARLPEGVYLRSIEPSWYILYQRTE